MIIDSHGHFTSEPAEFLRHRELQVAHAEGRGPAPSYAGISDDELRALVEANQLRVQRERGTDLTILSPRASGMGHHVPGQSLANEWARLSNDTVGRIATFFPRNFAAACQLPQTVDGGLDDVVAELERCVAAGFVACNVNPDPSGGAWSAPALPDPWWDPLWEALARLDVPAMIHVSASTRPALHTTGAYYLAADTTVFMQLLGSDLFDRHPGLRFVIPHGGGAVPYHWGRFRGIAARQGDSDAFDRWRGHVFFDTCVYHQAGIDLLLRTVGPENVLFGSELLGAVRGEDPETGHAYDDTRRYVEAVGLDGHELHRVFETNARAVYPRLDARIRDLTTAAPDGTGGRP